VRTLEVKGAHMNLPLSLSLAVFVLSVDSFAQIRTLREMVIDRNGPVNSATGANQPPISLDELVRHSDMIVRGKVATAVSYLSPDDTEVYTDLTVGNVTFVHPPEAAFTSKPGRAPSVVVTQLGGTVKVEGHLVRRTHSNLLPVPVGTEAIFLLVRENGKLMIAGRYLGVLAVEDNRLNPLTRTHWFVTEHRGKPVSEFVAAVTSIVAAGTTTRP
jgi:hypothetical protein